jgi:hypothetical protein
VADDDDAHWLLGELSEEAPGAVSADPTRDDLSDARRRRLSAVPADELALGDDAIELARAEETAALGAEAPVEAYLDSPAPTDEQPTLDEVMEAEPETGSPGEAGGSAEGADDPRRDEPPSRKPVRKTRGRASVPSWDEIMFGGPNDERSSTD